MVGTILLLVVTAAGLAWLFTGLTTQEWSLASQIWTKGVIRLSFYGVAALGGAVALTVAYRAQLLREREAADSEAISFAEQLQRAAEMLGHSQPAVRLGGVYALAHLADTYPERDNPVAWGRRQQCIDVLCAYLRLPYTPAAADGLTEMTESTTTRGTGNDEQTTSRTHSYRHDDREVRLSVIRLIANHLQSAAATSWCGHDYDFTGATFDGGDFSGATFSGGNVSFSGATFSGGNVSFSGATFSGGLVSFSGATFSGGDVTYYDATFSGASVPFVGATFSGGLVSFVGATFSGEVVTYYGATFSGASVSYDSATFSGGDVSYDLATFSGGEVCYDRATFSGGGVTYFDATFSGARVSYDRATFSGGEVCYDRATFSGEVVTYYGATFSGASVSYDRATFSGGNVSYGEPQRWAMFSGGEVSFRGADFAGAKVSFDSARFYEDVLSDLPWAAGELPPPGVSPSPWSVVLSQNSHLP